MCEVTIKYSSHHGSLELHAVEGCVLALRCQLSAIYDHNAIRIHDCDVGRGANLDLLAV